MRAPVRERIQTLAFAAGVTIREFVLRAMAHSGVRMDWDDVRDRRRQRP